MGPAYGHVEAPPARGQKTNPFTALELLAGAGIFVGATALAWRLHLTLASVAFLYFVMIIAAAIRWGFREATIASVVAVACLDYFFTEPLFSFQVTGPADWIALGAFEFAGLVTSRLSTQAQRQARIAGQERNNMARLYELSRGILLLDRHAAPAPQIAALIHQTLNVESVALFDSSVARAADAGDAGPELRDLARNAWLMDANRDSPETHTWCRLLRPGRNGIGAIALRGASLNHLLVDAAASIAAVALERARARAGRRNARRGCAAKRSAAYGGAGRAGARIQNTSNGHSGGQLRPAGDRIAQCG